MTLAVSLSPPRELTVEDLCTLTGDAERSVRRRVASWYDRQHQHELPRVRRARATGDDRWCYLVDCASYDAWLSREPAALPRTMVPGSDTAREHGCTCLVLTTEHARGRWVLETCPLHGSFVRE